MLPNPPSFLDWLQGLPLIQLAAWVIGIWLGIALLVHKAILPWAAGMDGRKLGTFSTGAAGLLGLMFALLLSINALSVWEQSGTAWNALRAEASALREIADLSSELSTERRRDVKVQLDAYLRYLVQTEWPRLGTHNVTLDRPLPLRSLARVVRAGSNDEMHGLMATAIGARETRIRIANYPAMPARWSLVTLLGALTVMATGLVHAQDPRARAIALGMVSLAIGCCFLVLLTHARPFLGVFALKPTEMVQLAADLSNP